MVKYRNESIDILRGLAMLFVIFQHTMSGVTVGAEQSFVFNIAWSLQMPLFILISGYITKYSRPIQTLSALGKVACKKTVAYMCPWLVWTFLVRGLLLGQTSFFDLKYILWKMDSGYWFLATIWVISLIYSCASFVAEQMNSKYLIKKQIIFVGVYILGMLVLVAVGLLFGISFFAIKLTLYYMPFYYAGYLYGQCEDKVKTLNLGKTIIDVTVAICLGVWLFIVLRYSVFDMSDSGIDIIFRVFTSLAGCIAISGLVSNLFENTTGGGGTEMGRSTLSRNIPVTLSIVGINKTSECTSSSQLSRDFIDSDKLSVDCWINNDGCSDSKSKRTFKKNSICKGQIKNILLWAGRNSLEIYVIHELVINILQREVPPLFSSIDGCFLTFINFTLTILLCYIIIAVVR